MADIVTDTLVDAFMQSASQEQMRDRIGLGTDVLEPQFAARSPDSGLVFTGSSAGVVSVIPDLKGSDWTLEYDVVVGSAYGASQSGFGLLGEGSGNDNSVRPHIAAAGTVAVYIRAVTTSAYISSGEQLELNTAYKVAYTFIDSTRVLAMYINGVSVYSAALSGSGLSEYNAIPTLDYLRVGGYGSQPFPGTMLGSRLWNVALTDAEVLTLHRFGWAALPSRIHAAGAGVAQTSGAFTVGKRYRITTFVAGDSFTNIGAGSNATGVEFTATGTTATTYTNGSTVTGIGVAGSWDFNDGAGYQQRDLSGGKRPMTLSTTGVQRLVPGETLVVIHDFSFSGTTSLQMTGQAVLPDLDWRLNFLTIETDTDVNITAGNVSSGTQLVTSEAVTADTPKELTIVAGSRIPTTANVWFTSSATATAKVVAHYSKIQTQ